MATPKQAAPKKRSAGAKKSGSKPKSDLVFPVGRIGSLLRRGQYARRVGASAAVYLTAVLEYLTAELLELTVKAATPAKKDGKQAPVPRLNPRILTLAVRHDEDLGALLKNVTVSRGGVLPAVDKALQKQQKVSKKSTATPSA